MKRLLMILCVLMLCLAAATAEERLDDAHRYALVGPVYEGFTWAVAVDGVTEDPYEEGVWHIIDVHGNRLTDEALLVFNRYFSQRPPCIRTAKPAASTRRAAWRFPLNFTKSYRFPLPAMP